MDRHLIAAVIERTMRRDPRFGTWAGLERAAGVSHTQMHRVKTASDKVSVAMFERIEGVLGLPSDTLITVGVRDLAGLRELGVSPDLVAWVAAKMSEGKDSVGNSSKAL